MKAPKLPRWLTWKRIETALLLGVIAFALHRFAPHLGAIAGVGDPIGEAPDVVFRTLEGDRVALQELRGKVVLVNFWATWCVPCRIEMPGFEKLYRETRAEGFVIVGISVDRSGTEGVRRFLDERDISYPNAIESPGLGAAFGGIPGIPTSFLIDREGVIRHRTFGIFPATGLGIAVRRLLKEAAPSTKDDS